MAPGTWGLTLGIGRKTGLTCNKHLLFTSTSVHRIRVCYIYGNMDPINIPQMLAYIPAPWILWCVDGGIIVCSVFPEWMRGYEGFVLQTSSNRCANCSHNSLQLKIQFQNDEIHMYKYIYNIIYI